VERRGRDPIRADDPSPNRRGPWRLPHRAAGRARLRRNRPRRASARHSDEQAHQHACWGGGLMARGRPLDPVDRVEEAAPEPPPLVPGVARALSPLVRRIVAPNPGIMTGPGTNTYLVGIDEIAVIDPGPDDETHLDAVAACGGDRIRWILVTHTHQDHSPGVGGLKERTGAEVLGFGD